MLTEEGVVSALSGLVADVRDELRRAAEHLPTERLPPWGHATRVRVGVVNGRSVVAAFDASDEPEDEFQWMGAVAADTAVIFDIPTLEPSQPMLPIGRNMQTGGILLQPKVGGADATPLVTFDIPVERSLTDAGQVEHLTMLFAQFGFRLRLDATSRVVLASRVVPLVMIFQEGALQQPGGLGINAIKGNILNMIAWTSDQSGDFYADLYQRRTTTPQPFHAPAYMVTRQKGVIVLGAYDPAEREQELRAVCDALNARGWTAHLIKDLDEIPGLLLAGKVRFWTSAARFCVMVDRNASGHIREYEIVKADETVLAFLQQQGTGSTWMVGEADALHRFIRTFKFIDSPLEVVDEAADWADAFLNEVDAEQKRRYPWAS
jgi:hypothetical protein